LTILRLRNPLCKRLRRIQIKKKKKRGGGGGGSEVALQETVEPLQV